MLTLIVALVIFKAQIIELSYMFLLWFWVIARLTRIAWTEGKRGTNEL